MIFWLEISPCREGGNAPFSNLKGTVRREEEPGNRGPAAAPTNDCRGIGGRPTRLSGAVSSSLECVGWGR